MTIKYHPVDVPYQPEKKGYIYPDPTPPSVMAVRDGGNVIFNPNKPITAEEHQAAVDFLNEVRRELYAPKPDATKLTRPACDRSTRH